MTRSSRRLVSTALCGASLTAATAASAQRSGDGAAQIAIAPETASRVRPWLETGDRADDACAVRDTSLVVVSTTHAVRVFDHATGREVRVIPGHHRVFCGDAATPLVTDDGASVRAWPLPAGEPRMLAPGAVADLFVGDGGPLLVQRAPGTASAPAPVVVRRLDGAVVREVRDVDPRARVYVATRRVLVVDVEEGRGEKRVVSLDTPDELRLDREAWVMAVLSDVVLIGTQEAVEGRRFGGGPSWIIPRFNAEDSPVVPIAQGQQVGLVREGRTFEAYDVATGRRLRRVTLPRPCGRAPCALRGASVDAAGVVTTYWQDELQTSQAWLARGSVVTGGFSRPALWAIDAEAERYGVPRARRGTSDLFLGEMARAGERSNVPARVAPAGEAVITAAPERVMRWTDARTSQTLWSALPLDALPLDARTGVTVPPDWPSAHAAVFDEMRWTAMRHHTLEWSANDDDSARTRRYVSRLVTLIRLYEPLRDPRTPLWTVRVPASDPRIDSFVEARLADDGRCVVMGYERHQEMLGEDGVLRWQAPLVGSARANSRLEADCQTLWVAQGTEVRVWRGTSPDAPLWRATLPRAAAAAPWRFGDDAVAVLLENADVAVLDRRTGALRSVAALGGDGRYVSVARSSDGRVLAVASRVSQRIVVLRVDGPPVLWETPGSWGELTMSPDGRWLARFSPAQEDRPLELADLRATSPTLRALDTPPGTTAAAFSESGAVLAYGSVTHVGLVDPATRGHWSLPASGHGVTEIRFVDHDRALLAADTREGGITVYAASAP